jgi:hypothetical protein
MVSCPRQGTIARAFGLDDAARRVLPQRGLWSQPNQNTRCVVRTILLCLL